MTYSHFEEFRKAEKKKDGPSGATIAGAGATTAGVGMVAGGIPKKKVSLEGINFTEKPKSVRQLVGDKAKVVGRMSQGGILGFRTEAHKGGLYDFNQQKTKSEFGMKRKPVNSRQAFSRARNAGKIAPEVKIVRHMSGGRKAAHGALVAGTGAVVYGADKHRKEIKKRDKAANDALIGAGAAGAGISAGGGALLSSQRRYWKKTASRAIDEGGKLAPATAGRRKGKFGRKTMDPSVTDGAIVRNKLLNSSPPSVAAKVGALRGEAAQARHFSHVFGNTGKVVAIGGGAASAAALHSGLKNRKKVKKGMTGHDAFGVETGISKKDEVEAKRRAAAAVVPGHAVIASKPGKKVKAQSNVTAARWSGAAIGTGLGAGATALALRGKGKGKLRATGAGVGAAGGFIGNEVGNQLAVSHNQKKGYYKKGVEDEWLRRG